MKQYKSTDLFNIICQFKVDGKCVGISRFGSGLVHESFETVCKRGNVYRRYLLQKINSYVFRDPVRVMENIDLVLKHLAKKIAQERDPEEGGRASLKLIPSSDNKSYYMDHEGNYWRIYHFIENTLVFDVAEKAEQAYEAARMFGQFGRYLSDLDPSSLHITIPDFHRLDVRLRQLQEAVRADIAGRVKECKPWLDYVAEHQAQAMPVCTLINQQEIPVRAVHHDTKINNVLMDKVTLRGLCVIDLDTVMPGTILSDVGDMIRTFTPNASEEEKSLSDLHCRLPVFKALVKGYLSEAGHFITNLEKENLVNSGIWITFMQGVRFLTDYLNGDVYYKTSFPGQNLNRAMNQFRLLDSIMANRSTMEKIVARY